MNRNKDIIKSLENVIDKLLSKIEPEIGDIIVHGKTYTVGRMIGYKEAGRVLIIEHIKSKKRVYWRRDNVYVAI